MYDTDKRLLLSAVCHGTTLFSLSVVSVGIPIAILFVSNDPVIQTNAKESINFHLNVWFYGLMITGLIVISFGLLQFLGLGFLGLMIHWGLSIWGLFNVLTNPDKPFRYPFIFRVI
jgi:uncharacterized protein